MFTLTRRMFIEARTANLLLNHVNTYYDNNDNYNGDETRIDDLVYTAELEWDVLFDTTTKEVNYSVSVNNV